MTHDTVTQHDDEAPRLLGIAVLAGLAAGLTRPLAGAAFAGVGPAPVELHHATAAMSAAAFGLHLVYSVVFGAIFVGAVVWTVPDRLREAAGAVVGLGVAYGLALWLVNVAVGWPLIQNLVGVGTHAVPHLHTGPLVVHVLYGLVLGGVVAVAAR